jgi:uncharacterized protein YyaL (SSP411 family)
VAIHVLQQLGELTGDSNYHRLAWQTAAWAAAQLNNAPGAMPYSLILWNDLVRYNPDAEQ